ncbi:hypothetical protein LNKW23_05020 [Paralimibaculum aggregatum]|uniref:Uncharacterized protein n=1 Tax=Paralimibaculum aggregatum TaxID=3036245 RepID=A0ABQ6LD48_9RHOB|nr:hypothetical protein [Limibaculum sp. NKW23]GMG81289.1 hypothetical protein LNKW23_05020 [Limibaculum sp. NKW23]
MNIDVKQAIAIAKEYAKEIFEDEGLGAPSLEEIWFDDEKNEWCVTVGLRVGPMVRMAEVAAQMGMAGRDNIVYKTVRVSAIDGTPVSVTIREVAA